VTDKGKVEVLGEKTASIPFCKAQFACSVLGRNLVIHVKKSAAEVNYHIQLCKYEN
jgi:hypothetical protein